MTEVNQQKANRRKSHLPFRLNLFFFIIFLLFSLLMFRLWDLQVIKGQIYTQTLSSTKTAQTRRNVPRGKLLDVNGKLLVGNIAEKAINFTRGSVSNMTGDQMITLAKKLAPLISFPIDGLRERDLQDYWVITHKEEVAARMSDSEKSLNGPELYEVQLSKVTAEDLVFTDDEKEVIAIFTKMNSAYALSTIALKNSGVTDDEIARVAEHLSDLEGISIGTNWERTYPENDLLRTVFGSVTTEKIGIPLEQQKTYLARGYSNNDRIGTGYLEQQYEDVLRGTKAMYDVKTVNNSNEVVSMTERYVGASGGNLVLSLNTTLQQKVSDIATEVLQSDLAVRGLNHSIYIVVQDPRNGDVLALVGKKYEYDAASDSYNRQKIIDDALGNINNNYSMGSSIKAATVAMGYYHKLINVNDNVIIDEPLRFQGSKPLQSIFNASSAIPLDDLTALERSSNVYMVKLAMRLGGQYNYVEDGLLTILDDTLEKERLFFAQFGLGVKTGIDVPHESVGYRGVGSDYLGALNIAFGQYDTYTPLQISQYMSTVASKGRRYAPRLVKQIMTGDSANPQLQVAATIPPKLLNTVDLSSEEWDRIHQGLYRVIRGQQAALASLYRNSPLSVSGKTGTAETFYNGEEQRYNGEEVNNSIFSGYSPSDNPEVTVTVVFPNHRNELTRVAAETAKRVFETYYDVYRN